MTRARILTKNRSSRAPWPPARRAQPYIIQRPHTRSLGARGPGAARLARSYCTDRTETARSHARGGTGQGRACRFYIAFDSYSVLLLSISPLKKYVSLHFCRTMLSLLCTGANFLRHIISIMRKFFFLTFGMVSASPHKIWLKMGFW